MFIYYNQYSMTANQNPTLSLTEYFNMNYN